MDLLKEEVKRNREALAFETGGKKLFKRFETGDRNGSRSFARKRNANRELKSAKFNANNPSSPNPNPNKATDPPKKSEDFSRDIVELKKRQRSGIVSERRMKKEKENGGEDGEGLKRMKENFEELCGEDRILVFFKRLLNEWIQELDDTMTEAEKRKAKGKQMECARYLTPLFKFCRKKIIPPDIRQGLLIVVACCMKRDYLAAMDQYMKLAIGNAPWPIGVTMVGIHERSAREKIYTNSVAHIMNNETTGNYLQSMKRLMTFCEHKYPAMPSKAIEFNSLANGSDLQSLLFEENAIDKNQGSDLKLRLPVSAS
ncbi:hypothetical protein Scep_009481 [Stephania cephalantha]|uniref:Pre-mRNA-splicing factor 18 n=1 Tax=Stephania cephalantha TaxID=152367 RepID=A0AAP0JVK9_9MAGN